MVDTVVTSKHQFVGTSPEDSNLSFRRACITFSITLDQSVLEKPTNVFCRPPYRMVPLNTSDK